MKANLELLIMIIYTAHALPIKDPAKEAQNTRKDSPDASPNFVTLNGSSIKKLRFNFLFGLQNVMDDWKESREKTIFSDTSSEIKKLNTTGRSRNTAGRSRGKDTAKVLKLTDSQNSQIKESYNTNLTNTEKKLFEKETEETNPAHKGILGRSKIHNEHTSDIYIWSSNALTEEQWETIQKNVQENEDKIKSGYDDVEKNTEKYGNHTLKNADGRRHRHLDTKNVSIEPKYYSFSKSEWEKLKQTLHKHLIGEDEKILKVNEDPTKNVKHSGRNRNGTVESPSLPLWSLWSSYALKPSEWDQLKQNIHHNEFIMNKTKNNIDPVGRGRSNVENFSINSYNNESSAKDVNAVIVKPVTGERLYNLRKNFDWDRLLESISSKDSNTTDEVKDGISNVDSSDADNNQSNDENENSINESQTGRSRKLGRQGQVIGIMPSLVLDDDEDFNNFQEVGSEKEIFVGVEENNLDSNKSVGISIQENEVNIQNTEQTAINLVSDSTDSELKNNVNTFTSSPTYLTDGILDYDTTASLQLKPNTSRENYILEQSVESDNSTSTIAYNTSDTEKSNTTESVDFENSKRENNVKITTEIMDSTTVEYENSTRENYVKIKTETDATEIIDSSTPTQNKDANIRDTTDMNDIFTVNALNKDATQYTVIDDYTTEDYYINSTIILNKNESEYTNINDNTTTEVFIIDLSENNLVVSTAEVMNFNENPTTENFDTTISINDTIYSIDTESSKILSNFSIIDLSEFTTTEDSERTLITDMYSPDALDNDTDAILGNVSTVPQVYDSTTKDTNYGFFGLFGLFDKSNSKITTTNSLNDFAVNESMDPSTTTDNGLSVLINDDGYVVKENRFDSTTVEYENSTRGNYVKIKTETDPSTTTDSGLSVIINDDGYVVKENRFDILEEMLLSTTTDVLFRNTEKNLVLEKETPFVMDEEKIIPTTDNFDSISEYFSTTESEKLGAVLLNSDSVSTSIENPSSVNDSLPAFDLEINKATTNIGLEMEKTTSNNLNVSDFGEMASSEVMISDVNNQSEDAKNDEVTLDIVTFIPSSSADVSENVSIKSSSEILSTTQIMEANEAGIYSGTDKLQNEEPYIEPVSNMMPTWIILLIVLILSLIVIAVGFLVVLRLKRQTGHIQLSP